MEQQNEFKAGKLKVKIFKDRNELGICAANEVSSKIKELLTKIEYVNIIFAAAPSQKELLDGLSKKSGINWGHVNAFHMDEYVGLDSHHSQRFGNFLNRKIFEKVRFHKVYLFNPDSSDPVEDCKRYEKLICQFPPHIVCMGIGENTHVAFNDPHEANFNDPLLVKVVHLDGASRRQQVHDGCFSSIREVPRTAITLTVPALMSAKFIYCIVPGIKKANAVFHTINSKISEKYPATVLRNCPRAVLYLDVDSASKLTIEKGQL